MQRAGAILIAPALAVVAVVVAFLLFGSPDEEPAATPSAEASVGTVPSPSPGESFNVDLLERRWSVLFVGTDLDAAREQRGEPVSADALMLVSLSSDQSSLAMVSLPRDTIDVPLPGGETYERKINALYRERGIDTLVDGLELLLAVPIDAHVVLDMDDFTRLVGAVGTIEVSPSEPLRDPIVSIDLEAGPQEIDATTANGYVRSRIDQDYGRMGRQQEVMMAIIDRIVDPETDLDLRALLDSLESLETDLPIEDLPTLLELARRAADAEVQRLVIEPPLITFEGDRGDGRGYILEPDIEAIRAEVRSLIDE